jgi:thiamine biosynthesis lipoprotein
VIHNLLSATVIAKKCMDADAFGTSFMVLGLDKSIKILNENSELEAILIYSEDGAIKSYYTPNIKKVVEELK